MTPESSLPKEQDDTLITIGKKHSLSSKVLNEERPYWVHLPASYNDTVHAPQSYPVLYLLDGDAAFHTATGVLDFMSGSLQMPACIVVALPNTDRTRDLTPTHTKIGFDGKQTDFLENSGGGDAFLRFIREELFPEIESSYRTLPYRLLVGHSFGGLLTLHALLNKPGMFHAHLSIDPSCWWDDEILKRQAQQMLSAGKALKGSTYISLAHSLFEDLDDPEVIKTTTRAFSKTLESFVSSDFRFEFQYFAAEDHGSVPLLSLYHGLLSIFEGHKVDMDKAVQQPSSLSAHFEAVSERLGITLLPPEGFVNDLGFHLLNDRKETDKAFEAFRLNATNYPESYNVHKSLAEAYEAKDEPALAIEHYRKALALNPDSQEVEDQLRKLQEA